MLKNWLITELWKRMLRKIHFTMKDNVEKIKRNCLLLLEYSWEYMRWIEIIVLCITHVQHAFVWCMSVRIFLLHYWKWDAKKKFFRNSIHLEWVIVSRIPLKYTLFRYKDTVCKVYVTVGNNIVEMFSTYHIKTLLFEFLIFLFYLL